MPKKLVPPKTTRIEKIPQTEYAGAEGWHSRHDFSTCVEKKLDAFHCAPF
jgi:hypothetical protein